MSPTLKKYKDIREEYRTKYLDKTYKGARIFTDRYAFIKLSEKFYLAPRTIENIIFHRVGYSK